jgi:hypothetical protein
MRCCSVRLVAKLATHHTDFESFTNALGTLPNQPPVPMACEPSPSPIDVDTRAIVQQVVDVLLKHSPSPAVHLEVLGRRWLALARNESVSNLTSTLLPAKAPAMKMRDNRAREVLELMPVTPGCPQATIALLTSKASTHRSAADIKVLLRCGNRGAVQLAEDGLKQPTSATSKVVPAATIKALDAHRAAEAQKNGEKRAWVRAEDVALLELHAGDLPMSTRHPALVNRSHSARRHRMLLLQKHVGGLVRATFSKSITNQAGPLLELHYDRWTRLAPDLALPENAQVDWLNGVARAPTAWDLQLDPDAIVLFDSARDEWLVAFKLLYSLMLNHDQSVFLVSPPTDGRVHTTQMTPFCNRPCGLCWQNEGVEVHRRSLQPHSCERETRREGGECEQGSRLL